jgi:hypothetical protein
LRHRLTHGVGQHRPDTDRAPIDIEQRVDGFHRGLEHASRKRIELQLHRLAGPQLALEALRQAEIGIHAADVFQVDQVGAILDVVAEVDVADADRAVERRQDGHARPARTGQGQLRLGNLHIGIALVKHALGHETLGHQFLVALEVGLGNRHLGLGLLDLGALQRVVELHQHLPAAHHGAVGKTDLAHPAGDFGAQHHTLA